MVRFSKLAPLSLDKRLELAVLALGFFSPANYPEMARTLGQTPSPTEIRPFAGSDFLKFLKATGRFDNPAQITARVRELLLQLELSGLLHPVGRGPNLMLGTEYYALRELTAREKTGVTWLSKALGPEFVYYLFSTATVQLPGTTPAGDLHAGTALVVAPTWLLTCRHVLTDMTLDLNQRRGNQTFSIANTLHHDHLDVGLVETDSPLAVMAGLSFRDPILAETAYTIGYPRVPLAKEPKLILQRGEVTATQVETLLRGEVFLYSAVARPGNSGGPIVSSEGHVVGIVTEELLQQSAAFEMPFHAGLSASTIASAIADLGSPFELPFENYE